MAVLSLSEDSCPQTLEDSMSEPSCYLCGRSSIIEAGGSA